EGIPCWWSVLCFCLRGGGGGGGCLGGRLQGITDVTTAVTASLRRRAGSRSPAAAAASRRDATNVLLVFAFSSGLSDAHVSSSTDCRSLRASGSSTSIVGTCCYLSPLATYSRGSPCR